MDGVLFGMPRFFVSPESIRENKVILEGNDAHHISRSLRMAAGEHITVCDMQMNEYDCVLEHFGENFVEARIEEKYVSKSEPEYKIHVYQALPKGDKLDFIVQKSVECGAYSINLFESERCISKIKKDKESKKAERLNKIALEAAKQCGRGIVPRVHDPLTFKEAIEEAKKADIPIFCYENEKNASLKNILSEYKSKIKKDAEISVVIGSEGGFSEAEAKYAENSGMIAAGLGNRILRCETAPIFVLGCIAYEFEL